MEQSSFTTPDGITIHTVHWEPDGDSERVIIIVHGIGEHSGRYQHVAEKLIQADYHVYALDHRGHGLSSGKRTFIPSQTSYITDLKQFYDRIRDKHPSAKIYMLAHSMGTVIGLQFILTYPDAISAIVITGSSTNLGELAAPGIRMVSNLIHMIFPNAAIIRPIGSEVLTHDEEMLKAAEADPLNYKGWTKVAPVKYMVDIGEMIQERAGEITMPILIMHGGADQLTPISGSHIMYERVGSEDKTLKIWDNMRHEIMNEVERETVIQTIVDWFNKH